MAHVIYRIISYLDHNRGNNYTVPATYICNSKEPIQKPLHKKREETSPKIEYSTRIRPLTIYYRTNKEQHENQHRREFEATTITCVHLVFLRRIWFHWRSLSFRSFEYSCKSDLYKNLCNKLNKSRTKKPNAA